MKYQNRGCRPSSCGVARADTVDNRMSSCSRCPAAAYRSRYEVAHALGLPLDVFLVRKIGVPFHPELAMGAIAEGGVRVLNRRIIEEARISPARSRTDRRRASGWSWSGASRCTGGERHCRR